MKQSPAEKVQARHTAALEVVAALRLASKKSRFTTEKRQLEALALRIEECNKPENQFLAKDAVAYETGEAFDAYGQLWQCNSKLCSNCLAIQARRNRKKLRAALDRQKLFKGERFYFATLTIPNRGLDLVATRDIIDRAWTLFRKRKLCASLFRGGAKSEEFTLTATGYHYHLHLLLLSKFVFYQEVRRVWTECVEKAFEDAHQPFQVDTRDGLLIVKILPVTDREGSIHEVCKYITKSDSWSKMRSEDLTDIAMIRRWFRMFELFGSFAAKNEDKTDSERAPRKQSRIVHTRNLSDGVSPSPNTYWRDYVDEHGLDAYKSELFAEIGATQRIRIEQIQTRWPTASLIVGRDGPSP